MNILIRAAKIEDASTITKAEQEIAKTPGFFCSQPDELIEENISQTISNVSESKAGIYLVAEYEGQIVGHALLEPLPLKSISHVGQLSIGVHNGWQEKGIGKKLMQYLIDWAKKSKNIEKIELNVLASNERAIGLYKKLGFVEEGRLKNRVKIADNCYLDEVAMALLVKEIP